MCIRSFCFGLPAVFGYHSRISFPLLARLHGRNILTKPFNKIVADVSKIFRKGIQVRMREVYFQWHIAPHNSVDFKHFLSQLSVSVLCVCPESCQQAIWMVLTLSCQFLLELIKIPVIRNLIYLRTDEDHFFYLCIADSWKRLWQIPKTFSIPVHGLHISFHQLRLQVKLR